MLAAHILASALVLVSWSQGLQGLPGRRVYDGDSPPYDSQVLYQSLPLKGSGRNGGPRTRRSPDPSGGFRKFPSSESQRQGRRQFGGGPQVMTKSANTECGIQKIPFVPPMFNRQGRILNGTCAPYGSFPWMVQIQKRKFGSKTYEHHCGGALLSSKHVLSASHCFRDIEGTDYQVVVGQDNFGQIDEHQMTFDVDQFHLHEKYQTEGPYSHDLALIKLRQKGDGAGVRFSRHVQPICLPTHHHFKDDSQCVITGWGKIKPQGQVKPDCMRAASIPIVNYSYCEKMYEFTQQALIDSMICAGYSGGGVDTCQGDSGGPLACYSGGSYQLAGVISWGGKGNGCGKAESPGVYTKVQSYTDWITEKMSI